MHLSIAVPSGCGNKCKFCIANMQRDVYEASACDVSDSLRDAYVRRMAYAKEAGCTSLTITGEGEPMLNMRFLKFIGECNRELSSPFYHIQLQTSGIQLNRIMLGFLTEGVGITGVSLSLCHFDSLLNASYTCPKSPEFFVPVDEVCHRLVDAGIPIRLCLNLTDLLHYVRPEKIIFEAQRLGASQLTFRELFASKDICEETQWIMRHRADAQFVSRLKWYIHEHGRGLPSLGTGLKHYSLSGMSVVVDSDCMALSRPDTPRTLILREDHRLYSRWDDKGSLIF